MNVIILAGAKTSDVGSYPPYLTEINHSPLIQTLSESLSVIEGARVIIPINAGDDLKYNLRRSLEQISNKPTIIVCNETKGALISALLCIDEMNLDESLLVINGNEYIDCDFSAVVKKFASTKSDLGIVCFDSIHPRYSHAVVTDNDVERIVFHAVEGGKACTGLVWFKDASVFFDSACKAVLKKSGSEARFYFNEVVNQMILDGRTAYATEIDNRDYYPLKSSADLLSLRELLRKDSL